MESPLTAMSYMKHSQEVSQVGSTSSEILHRCQRQPLRYACISFSDYQRQRRHFIQSLIGLTLTLGMHLLNADANAGNHCDWSY